MSISSGISMFEDMNIEQQYLNLLSKIKREGFDRDDRTGVGSRAIWGASIRHDFRVAGFPLITTKKMWFKGIKAELLWMLQGQPELDFLVEHGCEKIWQPWSTDGAIRNSYPTEWRHHGDERFQNVDQIRLVIEQIKNNPNSRRHLVVAWDPDNVWNGAVKLPPCHFAFQFQVQKDQLHCNFMMRSSDAPIGLPWNIAFYGLLQCMVAQVTNLKPGVLTFWGNDVHIYHNQFDLIDTQLDRGSVCYLFPALELNPNIKDIDQFTMDDIKIVGYNHHDAINYPVAV